MAQHDPYAAFRSVNYRYYASGRLFAIVGSQIQGAAIGWLLYEKTNSKMALGLVGLIQALPILFFALPAGHVADKFNRKYVICTAQTILALCSFTLGVITLHDFSVTAVYTILFVAGIARIFSIPSTASLLPLIVPSTAFQNAVTWNSSTFELGSVIGPAIAGILIAKFGAIKVFFLNGIFALFCVTLLSRIKVVSKPPTNERMSIDSLLAGLRFVWNTKLILAAVTIDLLAVLLGGATALLPVYAKDILHVGPTGFGWLRAAPSIGAVTMALTLAHSPSFKHAGKTLLWAIAGFGVFAIIFGVSESFILSIICLIALGALDNISVVIRHTLIQVFTPDSMRGRVSAVNSVFIGMSNELGSFESGVAARYLGTVRSVVLGGIGTILVVLFSGWKWPQLRNLKTLHKNEETKTPYNEEPVSTKE